MDAPPPKKKQQHTFEWKMAGIQLWRGRNLLEQQSNNVVIIDPDVAVQSVCVCA